MARRASKNPRYRAEQRAAAEQRLALEERWEELLVEAPAEWADWVTFAPNADQPRHRWFPYRQGLARQLVDAFAEAQSLRRGATLLDPFAGSGTVPLAAAERGLRGVGGDAQPALAALARAKAARGPAPAAPRAASRCCWPRRWPRPRPARTARAVAAARAAPSSTWRGPRCARSTTTSTARSRASCWR